MAAVPFGLFPPTTICLWKIVPLKEIRPLGDLVSVVCMHLTLKPYSINNTIVLILSVFKQCAAEYAGGELLSYNIALPKRLLDLPTNCGQDFENFITVRKCRFSHNQAEYGAGTSILAHFSDSLAKFSHHVYF